MKSLIVLIAGLLAVGCATLTPEEKQKDFRISVIGIYEHTGRNNTFKWVFLENGIAEYYRNGKQGGEFKWAIVGGEKHVDGGVAGIEVYRINKERSIAQIAYISDGKRTDFSKEDQLTYKKIK